MHIWNWFPINAGAAIQSRMHRRAMLDSCRISQEAKMRPEARAAAEKMASLIREDQKAARYPDAWGVYYEDGSR